VALDHLVGSELAADVGVVDELDPLLGEDVDTPVDDRLLKLCLLYTSDAADERS